MLALVIVIFALLEKEISLRIVYVVFTQYVSLYVVLYIILYYI